MLPESMRLRITLGLLIYAVTLSVVILTMGTALSERREKAVWRAMLASSLERDARAAGLVDANANRIDPVRLYDLDSQAASTLPRAIRRLPPGLHEGIVADGTTYAILVHVVSGHRIAAVSDVSSHEQAEQRFFLVILGVIAAGVGLLLLLTWWLAGRLLRPVSTLGRQVHALDPGHRGERVATGYVQQEVLAIETAVNAFLERLDAFVIREREFIDTVSHELRTPISVIAGAAELLEEAVPDEAAAQGALSRIRTTVGEMDETIAALLFLAKDPTAFAVTEPLRLDELLPAIIADHGPLQSSRGITVELVAAEPTSVMVPARIAAVAVGNMLRNAIEHTPAGKVCVALRAGVVTIDNAADEVDPALISARYRAAATASAPRNAGGGIGLYVIRRICERLGWELDFEALPNGDLRCQLDVRGTMVPARG
jgi:signal transduction histidine kinase